MIDILKKRFTENKERHLGISFGEVDVIVINDKLYTCDCVKETPECP